MARTEKLQRRHHIVPKFYLRRFADARGLLRRVVLPGDIQHSVSINDATVAKDFYLVEEEGGSRTDKVEKLLSTVEAEAADAFREVVDHAVWPIPDKARLSIASWAAFQALRTTVTCQSGAEIADILLKLQIGAGGEPQIRATLRESLGREPSEAEVEKQWAHLSDFDSYSVAPHPNEHIKTMLELMPGTAHMFYDRGWNLIRYRRKSIVTGDNPVILIARPDHPRWSGVGLGTAGAILVPLDRLVALLMGELRTKDQRLPGSAAMANSFNWLVVGQAHTTVFHRPEDEPLAGMTLPQPRERITGGYEQVKNFVFPDGMPPFPSGFHRSTL